MNLPFAVADDLAGRWRTLTAEEQDRADILLMDASRMIAKAFVKAGVVLDDQITAETLSAEDLGQVACAMVKRVMMVPDAGVERDQATIGSVSLSRSFANPAGNLYLNRDDRTVLGLTSRSGRAFSVQMY